MSEDSPPLELDPYPPRLTPQIFGQEHAISTFLKSARGTRFAHAWLLSGPKGVGKASFAWAVAGAFLHHRQHDTLRTLTIPSDCVAARAIRQGVHPDLLLLTRKYDDKRGQFNKNILARDAYALRNFFQLKSASNGWRIAILDSLNEMDFRATNALLKILEEPPQRSLLFLIAHHSGRVLDTIRSRCRKLTFESLPPETITQVLQVHFPDLSATMAHQCAILADGSAARALHFAHANGITLHREMLALLMQLPDINIVALDKFARGFDAQHAPEDFSVFAQILSHWVSRVLIANARNIPLAPLFDTEAEIADKMVCAHNIQNWIALWQKIAHMERETITLNLDRKQTVQEWFAMAARVIAGGQI